MDAVENDEGAPNVDGAGELPKGPPGAGAAPGVAPNVPDPNKPPAGAGAPGAGAAGGLAPNKPPPVVEGAGVLPKTPPGAGVVDPNSGAGVGALPNKLLDPPVPKRPPGAGADEPNKELVAGACVFPMPCPGAEPGVGVAAAAALTYPTFTCSSNLLRLAAS